MNKDELKFWYSPLLKRLIAARPPSFTTILFREEHKDWVISPRDWAQVEGDAIYDGGDYDRITYEEAKNIFNDIYPDEKILDKIDNMIKNIMDEKIEK